jgi:hypothetical protein
MADEYFGGGSIGTLRWYTQHEVRTISPATVVDFGAGRGLMGQLCRDALGSDVHLTAVEGCPSTIPLLHKSGIYNQVDEALINDWVVKNKEPFDLAIYGDVLEHLTRRQAFAALSETLRFARNVIVNVPLRNLQQDGSEANPLEEHRAYFTEHCFLSRYLIQEMHFVNAGHAANAPGWEMLNCWIVGKKQFRLRAALKHRLLLIGGHRAKRVFSWFGREVY